MKPSERIAELWREAKQFRSPHEAFLRQAADCLAEYVEGFDVRLAALEFKGQPIARSRIQWRSEPVPKSGWYLVARVPDGGWGRNCYNAGHPCPDSWIPCDEFESPSE